MKALALRESDHLVVEKDNSNGDNVVNYIGLTLQKETLLKCLYFSRLRRRDMVGNGWCSHPQLGCCYESCIKGLNNLEFLDARNLLGLRNIQAAVLSET